MRTPNVALIHETVTLCFDRALSILGDRTKQTIYDYLERRGIGKEDVSSKFADVEHLLLQLYGQGGRSIMIGTLANLCNEYSVPLNLGYSDTLSDRLSQLMENILIQKLVPKHFRHSSDTVTFEDKTGAYASWTN